MKIGFGCDHAAFGMKKDLMRYLQEKGYECVDFGGFDETKRVNYPEPALAVAEAVVAGKVDKGILICGTGIGMSLAANKVPGIRAAHVTDSYSAAMASEHNNAQIITLGARITGPEIAYTIVDAFLTTPFGGGRHAERIAMIDEIEKKYLKVD